VGRTLLVGNSQTTWREWLKEHRGKAELLCLDPGDPVHLTPCILSLMKGDRRIYTRFYGSLDSQRHPHLLIAAAVEGLARAGDDVIIQSFAYRPSPVLRHTTALLAQLIRPDRMLIAEGTDIDQSGFPLGPESVELDRALPPMVQHAQRKAQWLKLLEECERHTVDLRRVNVEGARLGSGRALSAEQRKDACLGTAVHAEVTGTVLFIIMDGELDESELARALDYTGCNKAVFAEPGAYHNLLCSFASQDGEEFGLGIVLDIDWRSLRAQVLSTAVAPAPVRILRLGSMRVDTQARELGEARPWQV
jgi:hypothetical protein